MEAFNLQQSLLNDHISKMASDFNQKLLQSEPQIHRYSQFTVTHNNILRGTAAMLSRMFCFNSSMFLGYRNPQLSCAAARNSHLRSTGSETNAELLLQTPFCFTDIYITSGRYSVDHHSMVRK